MFWLGFVAGIAATFVALFVWFTRSGDIVDNLADEHANALGFDPGVRINGLDRE